MVLFVLFVAVDLLNILNLHAESLGCLEIERLLHSVLSCNALSRQLVFKSFSIDVGHGRLCLFLCAFKGHRQRRDLVVELVGQGLGFGVDAMITQDLLVDFVFLCGQFPFAFLSQTRGQRQLTLLPLLLLVLIYTERDPVLNFI